MDGLEWKIQLKWMIWGYRYFWKHPFVKKMAAFFLAQPNEGGAVDCAAEIAAAGNRQTTKVGGFSTVENHVGSQQGRCQWSPAVILASSHSISVATGRMGTKSLGSCAQKDPWKRISTWNLRKLEFDEFSFWNGPFL